VQATAEFSAALATEMAHNVESESAAVSDDVNSEISGDVVGSVESSVNTLLEIGL
jgi:hypothetical protein